MTLVRYINLIGCCAAAAGLLACGGKSTESAPAAPRTQPSAAAQPAPADPRPAIVAFGDSLTAGFGAEPGNSFPDYLQKELDQRGLAWRVVNAGVSGDTTTDGVNRLDEVLRAKPRIVIVEFGGNDGLRGLPIETTHANLEQIVTGLRGSGATVVLAGMTLPPNYGPDYIRQFETIYQDLAAKYKLTRIPFLLEGVATRPQLMQRDGLHPTAQGNAIVAQTVLRTLTPILK
jgi:acyl-CoA thioesterase-1